MTTQRKITAEDIRELLKNISFKDRKFVLLEDNDSPRMFLQVHYMDTCVETGEVEEQHTRKWLISPYMTKSEIVQTAFKAIITSQEHIAREFFTYRGKNVFGPHFNVDALWEICENKAYDIRGPKR